MALSLLSIHDPNMYKSSSSSTASVSPLASETPATTVRIDLSRRKQRNPKSLNSGIENTVEHEGDHDKSFDESNGSGVSVDESKDISELVKVEINNSSDDLENNEHNDSVNINTNIRSPQGHMVPPPMDEILRKSNMIPFGDVTVTNHPNTPPIPMTFPMVYLVPLTRDVVSGEVKYKMLVPRSGPGPDLAAFPPFFPLQSPPLLHQMNQRFPSFSADDDQATKKQGKSEAKTPNGKQSSGGGLKVDVQESESTSTPLDLTHRSPGSSEQEEGGRKESKTPSSSSPDQKLGSDIEEHLQFLKVKQMEFLKQAAETAQNRCNECNINFSKYQNYVAHKKYYCSGLKNQNQDSDEESSPPQQSSSAPAKKPTPLSSPSSPPFSSSTQTLSKQQQNMFNQEFFLNQKSLLESFPGKMPLLMTPPGLPLPQPGAAAAAGPASHFVCQGCGIKFKSISNLKAHQSRYCSGIKSSAEESLPSSAASAAVNPANLEALLKSQMQGAAAAAGLGQLSAADMITLLSAQHMAAVKNMENLEKKPGAAVSPSSPPSLVPVPRGKSPKTTSESAATSSSSSDTPGTKPDDFCLVLCGFKESNVDLNKLKEQFNMQFIGQVNNKRKSESGDAQEDIEANDASEDASDPKRVKLETAAGDPVEEKKKECCQEPEKEGMKCSNCNISFVNASTFRAHVNFYCKKRDPEQD